MSIDPGVAAALIAAFASLLLAILGFFTTQQNQRDVERLKAELAERQSEKDARRDYEYEARKRLYQEYEPLLFQLVESSEYAWHRVKSLARSARRGELLPNGNGWLDGSGYYLDSTLYYLMCPVAIFKLMKQRLTLVDLSLESRIQAQYRLAQQIFVTFTDDHELAQTDPLLPYDPFHMDWLTRRMSDPRQYWRQGLSVGRLDMAAETLIFSQGSGTSRILSFGEFQAALHTPQSNVQREFEFLMEILIGFHPKSRPILWRILIVQAHLYRALISISENRQSDAQATTRPVSIFNDEDRRNLDWRQPGGEDAEFDQVFLAARHYFSAKTPSMVDWEK